MTSEPAGGADDADDTNIELTKVEVVGPSSLSLSLRSSNAANSSGSLAKTLMSLFVVSLFGGVHRLDVASRTGVLTSGDNDSNSLCVNVTCVAIARSYTSVAIFPS